MTKKAIITTHDGREATIVTKASNVLFEDGQTAQDILNDRQDTMITPIITTSTSMSKVGQGDSVDYSENVVDGAYESCVLKGNTKVNLIQESSSQDVVLPYEFAEGQSVTISDTKESGAVGVELKGQTLVNSFITSYYQHGGMWGIIFFKSELMAKGKKYVIVLQHLPENCQWAVTNHDGSVMLLNYTEQLRGVFTSSLNGFEDTFALHINDGKTIRSLEELQKVKPMLIEYQEGMANWDIPYFEGMQSVQAPSVTTVGKNLLPNSDAIPFVSPATLKEMTGGNVFIEKGKTYTLNIHSITSATGLFRIGLLLFKDGINVTDVSCITFINGSLDYRGDVYKRFQTIGDTSTLNSVSFIANDNFEVYVSLVQGNNTDVNSIAKMQLEKNSVATTYEPYKTTTLTTPEEITLRGIGNVKDTLNTVTGELTQRIGEVVLDGSATLQQYHTHLINSNLRYIVGRISQPCKLQGNYNFNTCVSDFINTYYGFRHLLEGDWGEGLALNGGYFAITLDNGKLPEDNLNGVKTYLQQNPITVQYELKTPIISTIPLTFTNQDNQPATKLSTYNTTTHINASSKEGSLIPTLSHSNATYPAILKPSTKYSIVANSYSNGHTNSPINFNLGGATATTTVGNRVSTVTTPSTLTSDKLVMSGRGNKLNNVMVIEGDVAGDLPYFEGICDCKSPILSNVGKNLFDGELESGTIGYAGNLSEDTTRARSKNYIPIDSSQSYHLINYENYIFRAYYEYDSNKKFIRQIPSVGQSLILSFTSNTKYIKFVIAKPDTTSNIDSFTQKITIYLDNSNSESYEPYKSNILSCNGDRIELTEDMFEQGTFSTSQTGATYESTKENNNTRIRSKKLIRVKPSTTYCFKFDSSCQMLIGGYDSNQKCLGSEFAYTWLNERVFTTPANGHYISIAIRKGSGRSDITPSEFNSTGLAIWEVDKTIVLRSLPNGVCDTLDLMTGEYVQRIGEVVLDGSESWDIGELTQYFPTRKIFGCNISNGKIGSYIYNDKYVTQYFESLFNVKDIESICCGKAWSTQAGRVSVVTDKATNGSEWLTYLQANPITVQYELATPITTTIDLQGSPYAYKDGHIQLTSGSIEQSLTPVIEYSVPTNRNGQIRSNQKMVEKHQKELDKLQAIILANLVNSQYNQTLTTLNYELSRV